MKTFSEYVVLFSCAEVFNTNQKLTCKYFDRENLCCGKMFWTKYFI